MRKNVSERLSSVAQLVNYTQVSIVHPLISENRKSFSGQLDSARNSPPNPSSLLFSDEESDL